MTSLSSPIDFRYSSKLHVRLGYQHHRGDGHPGGGKRPAGELDVLPGVNGTRFNDDRVLGDTERHRVLGVVNGLAAREAGRRRRAVPAREHQHGEQADVVQVRGERRDSEVVAAQPDTRRARAELMVHLMVVPDEPGVGAVLVGDGVAGVHAVLSCRGSPRKPGCGDWLASDKASRRVANAPTRSRRSLGSDSLSVAGTVGWPVQPACSVSQLLTRHGMSYGRITRRTRRVQASFHQVFPIGYRTDLGSCGAHREGKPAGG